jgi:PAS domain S-box-containing protein
VSAIDQWARKGVLRLRLRTSSSFLDGLRIGRRDRKVPSDEVYDVAVAALERSETIVENVGDGIFSTDGAGEIQLWNRAANRLTGCPPKDARGKTCADVLAFRIGDRPLDCSRGCALMRETAGKPAGTSVEVIRRTADGREQPLLVNVTPIKGYGGDVTEFVHSMRDITALKLADEAKTMFLATASHELKTPLTVILGFTQALRAGWLDEERAQDALCSVERRAQELSRIVDRLLMTGRIESGRVQIDLSVVRLEEMVSERVLELATNTGRTIDWVRPNDVPPIIADREALTTILDHLIDNAVKYSPDGGNIVLSVSVDRDGVDLEISDPGIGMSEDEAARCFDRFWQAEASDVRRFGGTGVGLYVVRSLIVGMSGTIAVRSIPGRGTTFAVRFRRASNEEAAKVSPIPAEPGVGSE